ncbi:alanine racemase [Corynebacterium crudilactis]|uniref:D-serine dehydratase-like domain-containing protein n=1 Tax=Corynebacterium crudilactis TaxID=1652495 RepID=A0A172QVY1_9CORY|nr:alanine racemase [Corynebacterium crudilactis]ANE04801.1 hypothetical protein ccrud_11750 [Corynebacterium crudilactis]
MMIDTPAVLIDRERLATNIVQMAAHAAAHGIALRPHVKTHKIPEIAQIQVDAGARGITCATIGESEVFSEAGFQDIFIAYPLYLSERAVERLNALPGKVSIGVDSLEMARAVVNLREDVKALIEVDSGHHRSGISPDDEVLAEIRDVLGERYVGVFTFPGHSYGPGNGEAAAEDELHTLTSSVERLGGGLTSGGSSPSAQFTDALDEIRPGVYVFNDAQQVASGACGEEQVSMMVLSTVISRNVADRRIILDAGSKILSTDKPAWIEGHGFVLGQPNARISALSEHHATIFWPADIELPQVGEQIKVVPNHACNVINLVDEVYVQNSAEKLEIWSVAARGKNS